MKYSQLANIWLNAGSCRADVSCGGSRIHDNTIIFVFLNILYTSGKNIYKISTFNIEELTSWNG
jgi:hypothetical protein